MSDKKSVACPENVFWEKEAPGRKLHIAFAFVILKVINSEIILFRFALIPVSMVSNVSERQVIGSGKPYHKSLSEESKGGHRKLTFAHLREAQRCVRYMFKGLSLHFLP